MEERRLLLAVALSLLAVTSYTLLFPPKRPQPSAVAGPQAAPAPAAPTASPSPSQAAAAAAAPGQRSAPEPIALVADERERRVEVEGPEALVAFTNKGARLVSWKLVQFKDRTGHPEEMVQATREGPRPLDLETGNAAVDERLKGALYQASSEMLVLSHGRGTLRFSYADHEVGVTKEFEFLEDGLVRVKAEVGYQGKVLPVRLVWGPGIGNPTPEEMEVRGYQEPRGVLFAGGKVERVPAQKLEAPRSVGAADWSGVESQYFAALVIPNAAAGVELRRAALPAGTDGKSHAAAVAAVDLSAGSGEALLYVGPKDYQRLTRLGHRLAEVVPVGDWLGPLVVPLMRLLRWVYGHIGNYGWSIVVLTVLINLVMAPFRHYSIATGMKMAKVAPEMKVIQERYRKVPLMDPRRQQMQEEISALYARHGMNMGSQALVGCLPMLLTMPFLFAFYQVLTISIDLRGAPFLWILDLSQKDPIFLTPVLMGASMFLMQRMTPTTMDPAQQRVMLLMPVIFSGMLLWAPAGLNLYWFASNLCGLVQQGVTMSVLRGREAKPEGGRKEKRRK
jgi:YidC/Oxa1 family membrane protein insertase